MITLEEFHQDFLQSVLSHSESSGILKPEAFFEIVSGDLISVGDLTGDYTQAEYIKRGMEIYGYDFDSERKLLTLVNHQFFQEDKIQTLTKNQIDAKFTRLKNFFSKCSDGLFREVEETSAAYSMAYNIYRYLEKKDVQRLRLMILTDGRATRNLTDLPSEKTGAVQTDFRVVDIEYLFNIYRSNNQSGQFDVRVNLPCLKVNTKNDSYQSYLAVLNGDLLFDIYDTHGQKLFEQNVRTFLQFRGNVNKGLRNTITDKPEMFFAYNNGITATATEVEVNEEGNLTLIRNFQIVNGGQTTSAIYAAKKNSGISVSDISVQMKLSVVKDPEKTDDFISKVAEYANTQNKINNSDFFSNSPFHKEMKEYSARIYAPASGGSQRRTHWFYERVRGEFLNSQAYLKQEAKRKFLLENPKNQVFDKKLLSKAENAWLLKPDIVSKGAEDSFRKFAADVTEMIEKDSLSITETYFRNAVSKIIIFRATEKVITNADWYDGGFRAQTVAYTVAYLSYRTTQAGTPVNLNLIWELQAVPDGLKSILLTIAEAVYQKITHPPPGYANVTQWTKNSGCWASVMELDIDFGKPDPSLFVTREEAESAEKSSRQVKNIDKGIEVQILVSQIKQPVWKKVFEYYSGYKSSMQLNSMQLDILKKMSEGSIPLPSEKQAKILHPIYEHARKEGLNI